VQVRVGLKELLRSMPLRMPHGYTVSATGKIEGSFEVRIPSRATNRLNWQTIFLTFMLRIHKIVSFNWYIPFCMIVLGLLLGCFKNVLSRTG
jgi:hypothetical protein